MLLMPPPATRTEYNPDMGNAGNCTLLLPVTIVLDKYCPLGARTGEQRIPADRRGASGREGQIGASVPLNVRKPFDDAIGKETGIDAPFTIIDAMVEKL